MKLWSSFLKELRLSSKSFYFFIEILMAAIMLVILLFVVPENITTKEKQYIYIDLPTAAEEFVMNDIISDDLDGKPVYETIKSNGEEIRLTLYESEDQKRYLVNDEDDLLSIVDSERAVGATIRIDDDYQLTYTYYIQGYESERLQNLLLVIHNEDMQILEEVFDNQDVRTLSTEYRVLNDRQNLLPIFLMLNGSLMGVFILAAYIFLDKQEGVIKAFAVTPSTIFTYLMSKSLLLMVTGVVTSLILTIPIMGATINYFWLLVFLLSTSFFAAALGLLIAAFNDNIMQAFGVIFVIIIILGLPAISYSIPSWNPLWIKFLPSYPIVYGFKEIMINGNLLGFVLPASLGFIGGGALLFAYTNYRFKKTITV